MTFSTVRCCKTKRPAKADRVSFTDVAVYLYDWMAVASSSLMSKTV